MNSDTVKTVIGDHEMDVPARLMPSEKVIAPNTKLPWYTEKHSNKSDVYVSNDDLQIAVCLTHIDPSAAKENAEFIVTACNAHQDLIDALQAAKNGIQWFMDEYGAVECDYEMLEQIDAALRKAGVN